MTGIVVETDAMRLCGSGRGGPVVDYEAISPVVHMAPTTPGPHGLEQIQAIVRDVQDDFNTNDASQMNAPLTDDEIVVNIRGGELHPENGIRPPHVARAARSRQAASRGVTTPRYCRS